MRCDVTEADRLTLLLLVRGGGKCECGQPAVVLYSGAGVAKSGNRWSFSWPRCMTCPGVRRTQGVPIEARPLEPHHRALLNLLGDEAVFLAAVRLGYRPPAYGDDGKTIDGTVTIRLDLWDAA